MVDAVMVEQKQTIKFEFVKSEMSEKYQISRLLTIVAPLWGITIWASIPEEEEDRR